MNITIQQLKALRSILSPEQRKNIADQVGKSPRTIDAILQGDRVNNEIEQEIILQSKKRITYLSNLIAEIEAKNIITINISNYQKYKSSPAWANHPCYMRYMDIYIELSSFSFKSTKEIWEKLYLKYRDIIPHGYYCIALIERLVGIDDVTAVDFYNKKAAC